MSPRLRVPASFYLFFLLLPGSIGAAQPFRPLGGSELQLALNKLTVVGSALYVAAHPDDENTALLAWLASQRLVRAGYLSVTRGEGGQNLIGSEKGDLLGVIRTQELLAARQIDGAEQFFTRAVDFGYSKSPDETLRIWDRNKILSDVVWIIRSFRPDVIITRFPTSGAGGHGQHTASAILAEEAFAAAADPARFPEQLAHVRPWRAKRLVWNIFQRQGSPAPSSALSVDLGTYNPLLGRSYTEIAADSRSMHKSQGFGSAERRGSVVNRFQHLAGEPAQNDLFEGVDLTWDRFAGGGAVGAILERAARQFDPARPHQIVPLLLRAHEAMSALPEDPLVAAKRRELLEAIRSASGLWIEAIANKESASPGSEVKVAVTVVNRSPLEIRWTGAASTWGKIDFTAPETPQNNQPVTKELIAGVPADAPYSHPYWLSEVVPQRMIGRAENPPALAVTVQIAVEGQSIPFTVPTLYRFVDRVKGETYRAFLIAPSLTVQVPDPLHVFTTTQPRIARLRVEPNGPEKASVEVPKGWTARRNSTESFEIIPPVMQSSGELIARADGSDRSRVTIDYDHIPAQTLFPRASARLVRVDVKKRGNRIGYVMGPGDDVAAALREIGYDVTLISDEDLEQGDLKMYDAIVTGVRAYNTRESLRRSQPRLLDYVQSGGTLVVQYNTTDESLPANLAPYRLTISRDRVTVEEAPVTLQAPDHPLLVSPNKISAADFSGWVQERGLYFPGEWDASFQPLISTSDPGEPEEQGAILYARYGKGVYIYTGLAFFRQLPAGVPGAYRLFANLVSARSDAAGH